MSLNIYQQTFALSFLSNSGGSIEDLALNGSESITCQFEGAFEKNIADTLSTQLPLLNEASGTSWKTVWGPAVYVDPMDVKVSKDSDTDFSAAVTNCLIIFQNGSQYVVATSGTNFGSAFGASVEDASVISLKDWPYNATYNGKISSGTFRGLSILTQMLSNQQTAADFLASITDDNVEVIVTGHSLGGALSEALGVALCDKNSSLNPNLAANMKKSGWNGYVYPSAAPDIGDTGFAQLFQQVFEIQPVGDQAWEQFNNKIWNSLDVVPQSWANLDVVGGIYGKALSTPDYVKCIIDRTETAIKTANFGDNPYAPVYPNKSGQFQGNFCTDFSNTSIADDCSSGDTTSCSQSLTVPTEVCQFVGQMLYQHIDAYIDLILGEYGDIINFIKKGTISASDAACGLYNENIAYCKTSPEHIV